MIIESFIILQILAFIFLFVALLKPEEEHSHIISSMAFLFFVVVAVSSINIERYNCFESVTSETDVYSYNNKTFSTFASGRASITTAIELLAGTGNNHSGNIDSVGVIDQDYWIVNETGKFEMIFNVTFTETTGIVGFYGRYEGNPAHEVNIDAYNTQTDSFDTLVDIPSSASDDWVNHTITSTAAYINGHDKIMFRIHHPSSANPNHAMLVDFFQMFERVETKETLPDVDVSRIDNTKIVTDDCRTRQIIDYTAITALNIGLALFMLMWTFYLIFDEAMKFKRIKNKRIGED